MLEYCVNGSLNAFLAGRSGTWEGLHHGLALGAAKGLSYLHHELKEPLIHRDIKPENFCVRHDDSNRLCIVDFGLSKRFRDSHGAHIPHRMGKGLLGTPRYTSVRCHEGHEQSRRRARSHARTQNLRSGEQGVRKKQVRDGAKHGWSLSTM